MSSTSYTTDWFQQFFETFGTHLMPTWTRKKLYELKVSGKVYQDKNGMTVVTPDHDDIRMIGLQAFILLGVCKINYRHQKIETPQEPLSIKVSFIRTDRSVTGLSAINPEISDIYRFHQYLSEFAYECLEVFKAGSAIDVDSMLEIFGEVFNLGREKIRLEDLSTFGAQVIMNNFYYTLADHGLQEPNGQDAFDDDFLDFTSDVIANSESVRNTTEVPDLNFLDQVPFASEKKSESKITPSATHFQFVGITEAKQFGDEATQQLLEQLILVVLAKGFKSGKFRSFPSETEITQHNIVDKEVFQASILGSVLIMEKIAALYEKSPRQIRFAPSVLMLRKSIKRLPFINKSFRNQNLEGCIFQHAQPLIRHLAFDSNLNSITDRLFMKYTGSSEIVLNFPLLAKLVAPNQQQISSPQLRSKSQIFKHALASRVFGQKEAVDMGADLYYRAMYPGKSDNRGKVESFTLLGASQSGKSLLATCFAEVLGELEPELGFESCSLAMECYSNDEDVMKLLGSGSQYVDSGLGFLTTAAEINPRICFIFENIEKASPKVQNALLTLLESGEIADRTSNRNVSFSQCFFIFTTAVGASQLSNFS